jgi:hypothetical protein
MPTALDAQQISAGQADPTGARFVQIDDPPATIDHIGRIGRLIKKSAEVCGTRA